MTFYDREKCFALFSKSRFVDGVEDRITESWLLWNPAEIDDLLTPS
jgi:hypothetical protein